MSNKVLLSVFAVVAIVSMATETATAQIFNGQLLGRRSNASCCAPAPAPAPAPCCEAAPAPAPAPCCDSAPRVGVIKKVRTRISTMATPAPAPCCGTPVAAPAPAPVAAPCCGGVSAAAPVMSTSVVAAPAVVAPMTTSCCGGSVVAPAMTTTAMPMEGTIISTESMPVEGVVSGETILESGDAVQASPSDSTVTAAEVVEPPAAADSTEVAPEEDK